MIKEEEKKDQIKLRKQTTLAERRKIKLNNEEAARLAVKEKVTQLAE